MSDDSEEKKEDLRLNPRFAVEDSVLNAWWLDSAGEMRSTRSRVVDISAEGIALELPEPVMPLMVRFESDRFDVEGKGVVRHCHQVGEKHVVGLRFSGDLHWTPPEGEIRQPIPLSPSASRLRSLARGAKRVWRKLPRRKD